MVAKKCKYVLYRILGNDLPPRHKKGQTFKNTLFILKNEPAFEGCEKRWVVNRIVDKKQEAKIIDLLEKYSQPYIHLPFCKDEYDRIDSLDKLAKIIYVNHTNGARNKALCEGRRIADWILPLDGGCFFNRQGWEDMSKAIEAGTDFKYFMLPMTRCRDYAYPLKANFAADIEEKWMLGYKIIQAPTEPQIVFHSSSGDEFDENRGHDCADKAELLWRLGVPGIWDKWGLDKQKDESLKHRSAEFGKFDMAGYVIRLPSGNRRADKNNVLRNINRLQGIDSLINQIEGVSKGWASILTSRK